MAFNLNNNGVPQNFNGMNFNPQMINLPPNMINMNPNFAMNNQMQLNQNLINMMAMNPNAFGFNMINMNNMNNQNQGFQNNMRPFQFFQNNMGTGVQGGNLPRRVIPNIDSYPWYTGPRINVIFEISTGPKVNIPAPPNETVEGLLVKFCERAGISSNLLKKEIVCIYNANYVNPNTKKSIQEFFQQNMGLNDQAKIVVIDAQNIIGA